tara:strand:+ start:1636 stop:2727 length:1092 start_codon:yes stop_codon:yes gene_type:complete
MLSKSLETIVWATGSVGKHAIAGIIEHPELDLVGVKVYSADKEGKDSGDIAGIPSTGIKCTRDTDALIKMEADCIFYCAAQPDYDDIEAILRSGKNIVTTTGLLYPKALGSELQQRLKTACIAGDTSLHGSGINPAFISDVLPLTLSSLSRGVSHIRAAELANVEAYVASAPEVMVEGVGFGRSAEYALDPKRPFVLWMNEYFGQSLHMICDHVNQPLDSTRTQHEVALATKRVICGDVVIEHGTVACTRYQWLAEIDGQTVITLQILWVATPHIEPAWPEILGETGKWVVEIEGTPSIKCDIKIVDSLDPAKPGFMQHATGGVAATALHGVNAIPYVCRADSGIKTFLDLPIMASRGAFQQK